MTLVYRHQKNEPLTIAEMDGNFASLDQRLKALETQPLQAEGILALHQEGDKVTVQGTHGSTLGQIILPKVFPSLRGKWQASTSYRVFDWVQVENCLYSCKKPHESASFDREADMWTLVFALSL